MTFDYRRLNGAPKPKNFAGMLNGYAVYILNWCVRKKFREKCGLCMGEGEVIFALDDEGETGSEQCEECQGLGLQSCNFGQQVALIHSELSELLESHRRNNGEYVPDKHCPDFNTYEIEMADAIIRCLDMAAAYGWNIGEAVEAKMDFNETRPEKHGKAY